MTKPEEKPQEQGKNGDKSRSGFKRFFSAAPGKLRGGLSKMRLPGKTDLSALKTRAGGLMAGLFHKAKTSAPAATAGFRDAAKKILADHPELSRKTLIVNAATHKWTGSLRAQIKGRLSRKFQRRLKKAEQDASAHTGPAGNLLRGNKIDAMVVSPGKGDGTFTLYQEAGQLLSPRGSLGKYFAALFGISPSAEQASGDAYAVIRFLKEHGMESGGLSPLSINRAKTFIQTGDMQHLTSFVVDKVLADRNFAALTPAEVLTTVQKYVETYAPTLEASQQLAKDFAPLKGKLAPPDAESLKKLAEITLAPEASPLAFYLGQRALQDFFRDGQGVDMTTDDWKAAKAAITARLATVTLDDMFAKPPAPPKPTPSKPAPPRSASIKPAPGKPAPGKPTPGKPAAP